MKTLQMAQCEWPRRLPAGYWPPDADRAARAAATAVVVWRQRKRHVDAPPRARARARSARPRRRPEPPIMFGMINDETGAVTFPEARQGAIAADNYVNDYLGGINGHPIEIDNCVGDGTPADSRPLRQRARGQASDRDPRRAPTWARRPRSRSTPHANLAYLGGIPFTPGPDQGARTRSSSGR